MIKTILFSVYFFISSIIFVSAQQLNYDETYNTEIKDAYGLLDVPLPPGEWKLFDLEEVGSVSSGDFFVYASLMPANISDQERRYNDTLAVNLFGSSSLCGEAFYIRCENDHEIFKYSRNHKDSKRESVSYFIRCC